MTIQFFSLALAVVGGTLLAAGPVAAQHFDVFVGRPSAGVQTAFGGIEVDTGGISLFERVFESEMGEDPFDGTYTSGDPGFNHPADDAALPVGAASLLAGDEIFVTALSLTAGGVTESLFFWNGVGSVAFAPPSSVSFAVDTGSMTGSIGTAGAGGGFDDHPFFVLDDGDANAATFPAPGIYLAAFQAKVADLAPTVPLYLVMGTEGLITPEFLGVSQAEFDMLTDDDLEEALESVIEMAVEHVERNVAVPEPSLLVLVGVALGSVGLIIRRRW
ncbi:MAG: PEP-CTERM sorting domain-containing protein [Pirellulales bacterium]